MDTSLTLSTGTLTTGRPRLPTYDQRPRTSLTLPYISGLSSSHQKIFDFCFTSYLPLQAACPPERPSPNGGQKGVVYSIPYIDCLKVHIGQMGRGRCLKNGLKENHCALRNGDVAVSTPAEHTLVMDHGNGPW